MVRNTRGRRGAAAAELALTLPVLVFVVFAAVDFCRVFYFAAAVSNAARNAALHLSDPYTPTPYADATAAATADWPLDPAALTVSHTSSGTDAAVTASYTFETVVSSLGLPASVTIARTVRVRVAQPLPTKFS